MNGERTAGNVSVACEEPIVLVPSSLDSDDQEQPRVVPSASYPPKPVRDRRRKRKTLSDKFTISFDGAKESDRNAPMAALVVIPRSSVTVVPQFADTE